MRLWTVLGLGACLLGTTACDNNVASGCFPKGCELTLSCDQASCNIDEDADGISSVVDCDDLDDTVYPGATEICGNHRDDDCDESPICDGGETDADGDDYGDINSGGTDCDDANDAVHPGVAEICGDAIDNDCDLSLVCDGGGTDADGDEFSSVATGGTDCNDGDDSIYPGARERCDTVDDDCDGSIICDGGSIDGDGDAFASADSGGTDCDDALDTTFPGATEDCGTPELESCGVEPCDGSFTRLPVDSAQLTAVLDAGNDVWVVGTQDGRLYRSTTGGQSFTRVASLDYGTVTRIIRADVDTLAASLEQNDTDAQGVWLSTDEGENWTGAGTFSGLNGGHVTDLVATTGTPFGLLATTAGGGLYSSDDGGASFTQIGVGDVDPFAYAVAVDPADDQILVVATDEAVQRSTDGGTTWAATLTPLPFLERVRHIRLRLLGATLYLMVDGGRAWHSSDFGVTFTEFGQNAGSLRPRDLAAATDGSLGLASFDEGFLRSSDAAASWDTGVPAIGPRAAAVVALSTNGFAVAGPRGLFSVNGVETSRLRRGLDALPARDLALSNTGAVAVSSGDGTVWWTDDAGAAFTPIPTPSEELVASGWVGAELVMVGGDGAVWHWDGSALRQLAQGPMPVSAAVVDPSGAFSLAGGNPVASLVEATVSAPALAPISGLPGGSIVEALAFRDGALHVGTVDGSVLTRATGATELTAATTSPTGGSITALLAVTGQPIYATVGNVTGGLFRSDDDGDTFAAVGTDTGSTFVRGGCIEPVSGTVGIVASGSILTSVDQGDTWQALSGAPSGLYGNSLPLAIDCTLEDRSGTLVLWLATAERGVWITQLP